MTGLLVHVEGETEESFVNEALAPYLYDRGFSAVRARLIGNVRQRGRRGGIRPWSAVRKEIVNHLKQDRQCVAATMVDYYGMPSTGSRAWPGRGRAGKLAFPERAGAVEDALAADVGQAMGSGFDRSRLIPFVAMHEFEALLFSDCRRLAAGIDRPELAPSFQAIRDKFANPEEIDDSPATAPSKRIEKIVAGYQKPLLGTLAALEIGLPAMRAACPHFADWLARLERLHSADVSTARR